MSAPKHFFFDVDKTLTPSRSEMLAEHQPTFERLCSVADVAAVSGAKESQIRTQIPPKFNGKYFVLAQSGNHAIDKNGVTLWKEDLKEAEVQTILEFVEKIKTELNLAVKDENDLIENRGAQVSYSLIGHHESLERKYAFDPDATIRLDILKRHTADVEPLANAGIEV